MNWCLNLEEFKFPNQATHQTPFFLIGSCFTQNMAEKLNYYKFLTLCNPHGIIFNPLSIIQSLNDYLLNTQYTQKDLWQQDDVWHSWQHHSSFSGVNAEKCLLNINSSIQHAHNFLKSAQFVVITLGSAWVYYLKKNMQNNTEDFPVANNHRLPEAMFEKKLLTTEIMRLKMSEVIDKLLDFNPKLHIIFTVSPVRHLREGVIQNNRSKAELISVVHHIKDSYKQVFYFPAYEMMIDILRDYRFYAEDLVHPNYLATTYIWDIFIKKIFKPETQELINEIHQINKNLEHKPLIANSQKHQEFINTLHQKIKIIENKYDFLKF